MFSGFHRDVGEDYALLSYYTASSGNFYWRFGTTYQSHLQGSRIKSSGHFTDVSGSHLHGSRSLPEDGTNRLSRNVGTKLHYSLRNNSEERSSQIYRTFITNKEAPWPFKTQLTFFITKIRQVLSFPCNWQYTQESSHCQSFCLQTKDDSGGITTNSKRSFNAKVMKPGDFKFTSVPISIIFL